MIGFERQRGLNDYFNTSLLGLSTELDALQMKRFQKIKRAWNFYEGYHYEDLPTTDSPEITVNYCRAFVDKLVAFEVGKSFTINVRKIAENAVVQSEDNMNVLQYLQNVWEDNDQNKLVAELAQMKSITGESWVQVRYVDTEEMEDQDPFNEYPKGRIVITVMPTTTIIPEFDPHNKERLVSLVVIYTYDKVYQTPLLKRNKIEQVIYKQVWTKDTCTVIDGHTPPVEYPNKYGIIPFVQIKNLGIAGRTDGKSDLEDIIPLNTEYNLKDSNISEIIDYHSSPTTIVFGAKIGNLDKGANKLWGGLPKDARVENLELHSDLSASNTYLDKLKVAMCEIGGVPESSLGGASSVSNTSGVALQYINLPLIEKTRIKRLATTSGLERINKLILLISLLEGLITKPANLSNKDFYYSEVLLQDTMPKDMLLEVQQIQAEMSLGLESRKNAMKRVGRENIEELITEIDEDRKKNPELYGVKDQMLNSGMTNSQTPVEQVRIETTGKNG